MNSIILAILLTSPGQVTFTNSSPVVIPEEGNATTYPWQIKVSGYSGSVTSFALQMGGLSHTWTDDIGAVLIGPLGQKVLLFDGPGNSFPGTAVNNITLTFTDSAAGPLPSNGDFGTGTYKPGQDKYGDLIPLTQHPYADNFSSFLNTSSNGTYSLYIYDFAAGNGGSVKNWSVTMGGISPVPEAGWGMVACFLPFWLWRMFRGVHDEAGLGKVHQGKSLFHTTGEAKHD